MQLEAIATIISWDIQDPLKIHPRSSHHRHCRHLNFHLKMEKLMSDLRYSLKTVLCFIIACLLLPVLLISFLVVHYGNAVVNCVLSIKYPNLTISRSKKIRSLIDTPHNAGIFNFLLHVNGMPDLEHIKRVYEEQLTNARDSKGHLRYPKLRQQLVTCWGHYAWVKDNSSFNLANHIVWNTHKYRGRPVSHHNIEDFVSELVRKYIPADLPQWQVIIIPTLKNTERFSSNTTTTTTTTRLLSSSPPRRRHCDDDGQDDDFQSLIANLSSNAAECDNDDSSMQYYILVKIHHLIIAEEENLHISEMLMLQDSEQKTSSSSGESWKRPLRINITGIHNLGDSNHPRHHHHHHHHHNHYRRTDFRYFIKKPQQIMKLYREMQLVCLNGWNKFKYEYESLDTPDDDSQRIQLTHLTQVLSVILIIVVNLFQELWNNILQMNCCEQHTPNTRKGTRRSSSWTWTSIVRHSIQQDANRYHLNWPVIQMALSHSLHPCNIVKYTLRSIWSIIIVQGIIMLPLHLYCEFTALRELIFSGQTTLTGTYTYHLAIYIPLFLYAQLEFLQILWEIFKAPVNIFEELFQFPSKETNILHMKSYSGRKIVSFSKSIDGERLRQHFSTNIGKEEKEKLEFHESDYILSCLAASIHDYFKTYADSAPVPQILNTTCRLIGKGFLTNNEEDKTANIGGVVFLQLPLLNVTDRFQHARQIHTIIESIRKKQIMIYLASMGQTKYDLITALLPRVFTKICINYFSYIFPVTITEIHGETADFQTIWGQRVHDVLLFRPPQSKTCLSLNVHRFGSKYRLAIMADTQLGPDHSQITRSFEQYMQQHHHQ